MKINMKLNIDLTETSRGNAITILNALLADEVVLGAKARNCHWNVTGPHFHDLHKLFGSQYDALNGIMDEMAERAHAILEPAVHAAMKRRAAERALEFSSERIVPRLSRCE